MILEIDKRAGYYLEGGSRIKKSTAVVPNVPYYRGVFAKNKFVEVREGVRKRFYEQSDVMSPEGLELNPKVFKENKVSDDTSKPVDANTLEGMYRELQEYNIEHMSTWRIQVFEKQ